MCGICGIAQIGGPKRQLVEPDVLVRMTDVMTHRGPNDRGLHLAPGVALGVRRLSIVDVDGGHQPFANEDGSVFAVQNGELYNHGKIRSELRDRGHRFRSRCDTEILPHLYEEDGDELPARLRGKFGLAVWDERSGRALVARDRLGVKPLYYAVVGDRVVFASELKSLLASGLVDVTLDLEAIDTYLTLGYFPGPLTPLAHVRKLLPAHRLVVTNDVRVEPYWRFPSPAPDPGMTEDAAAEQLLAGLEEAVRLRLMSDVPLGAMLSGGLDSSLIVALMARNMSEPVKTFSVGFVEDGTRSELSDARSSRDAFGTDHHQLELSMHETAIELEDLVWALDEPLADLSALGFMALSELAARTRDGRARRPGSRRAVRRLLAAPSRCTHRSQPDRPARRRTRCRRPALPRRRTYARFARALGADDPAHGTSPCARRSFPLSSTSDRPAAPRDNESARMAVATVHRRPSGGRPRRDDVPRRAARPRGRHAPLLRSGVDGPLAGGSRAVPRPSGRRASSTVPPALKVRGTTTKYLVKRIAEAYPGRDHRQAEDGLLQPRDRFVAPRPARRPGGRLPPRRGAAFGQLLDGRACGVRSRGHTVPGESAYALLARGLALELPAARACPRRADPSPPSPRMTER